MHGPDDYAEEWQALYRVEGARRALKQAKKEAEVYRQVVLAWDVAATRSAIAEARRVAAWASAKAAEKAAGEAREAVQAAKQKAAEEKAALAWQQKKQQINEGALKRATDRTRWIAWAIAQGGKQFLVATSLGHKNTSTVSQELRCYIEAYLPETLYRDRWGYDAIDGNRQELVAKKLKGTPEPSRPKEWRDVGTLAAQRWWRARVNLGRPLDMGGPRGIWLEYRLGDGQQ